MAEPRRTFTREFKIAAVKLITEKGRSVSEAAKSLGIGTELLRRWKTALQAQGQQAFPGNGNLPPLEDELRRLKAENVRLKAERDILKKATALFAKESL
jgi:transposase